MTRRLIILFVALALFAVACGGGDEAIDSEDLVVDGTDDEPESAAPDIESTTSTSDTIPAGPPTTRGPAPVVVVEPLWAPALIESIKAGRCVDTSGPVSSMGRLDCKTPSHLALKYLALEADYFVTIDDALVEDCVEHLKTLGVETTPSGAAGLAALINLDDPAKLGITDHSRVLCYISEGPA